MRYRSDQVPYWRSPGVIIAGLGSLLMLVNAGRAFADPAAFAAYLGTPLSSPDDAALVHIYGLRAMFIGLLGAALLIRREWRALWMFALVAVVMPAGDVLVTLRSGAPASTVSRHIGIAMLLLTGGLLLRRDARTWLPASGSPKPVNLEANHAVDKS